VNETHRKRAVDVKDIREAKRIACSLDKNIGLLLRIRCRALCILGYSGKGDYLKYAGGRVYYVELGHFSDRTSNGDSEED
jgi:hypothetical protein